MKKYIEKWETRVSELEEENESLKKQLSTFQSQQQSQQQSQ
jgi:hypothetical protein